ncbi:hypothetical protein ACG02S_24000 [Roseateles sp. DC23W]|uniref:GDSL-like Lipase/Acylhydrolase family protein n=1 Tax=Pelomonas dachongensis TaxID=3299029 RepID=A0ABW7EU39_9BURK
MPNASELSLLADLLYPIQVDRGNPPASPTNAEYEWHLIAEGDSWFSIGGIPSTNVLSDLRLPRWTQVFNVAHPGDTIKNMSSIVTNPDFKKYVAKRNFDYPFHGLLLSAGGNDLIDHAGRLIIPRKKGSPATAPSSYVDLNALKNLLDTIVTQIGLVHQLWNSRTSLSAGRPIFMHTYDYPTPRNAPALFLGAAKLTDPWIYKAFSGMKLPIELQQRITDFLFDALADTLLKLDSSSGDGSALTNMHVVNTRNSLVRANPTEVGNSNDWLNEIHPNAGGYRKIAARLADRVAQVLSAGRPT